MRTLSVSINVKRFFLDSDAVVKRVGRQRARVMMRAGGKVRLIARRSIRRRKRPSRPGMPPSARAKGFGIKSILFALPPTSDSVVIGPLGGNSSPVPHVLEYGGTMYGGRSVGGRKRKIRYQARPFMRPALAKFQTHYPDLWKDAIKG